ncbi:MAG: class II aldolase/adducin family protein [Spartobacteria bacterium]
MSETGVIKFQYESSGGALAPFPGFEELNSARQEMRRLGLLGVDLNRIGFGNVSLRDGTNESFYITGSGTGALPELSLGHYAKVTAWNFERNWLRCEGQAIASAESLTHAAIYAIEAEVRVVLHGHDGARWRNLRARGTATSPDVAYGTPEMAAEVQRLFRETDLRTKKVFAMAGHEEGIVALGSDFAEAFAALAAAR